MESHISKEEITCGKCGFMFPRTRELRFCANCFACTGCEIYYCPECDEEIIVTPQKTMRRREEGSGQ